MNDNTEPDIARPGNRPHSRTKRTKRNPFLAIEMMERRIVCSGGALDTSFDGTGKQIIPFPDSTPVTTGPSTASANAVAVESDGSIIMVGSAGVPIDDGTQSQQQFALAEVDADGQLDTTFGTGGQETLPIWANGVAMEDCGNAVAIQPNGDILIAGYIGTSATDVYQPPSQVFVVLRLLPNGSLDPTFGTGGVQTVTFPGSISAAAYAIALQPNGDIVVAGQTESNSSAEGGNTEMSFAVARLTPTGELDSTFGSAGVLSTFPPNPNDSLESVQAIALQPDGKILLAGSFDNQFAVARLNPDGTPDTTFGSGGLESFNAGNFDAQTARAIALQSNGQIVVSGYDLYGLIVARLDADGALDDSFDGTGILNIESGDSVDGAKTEGAQAVVVEPDGRIDVAGTLANPYVDFEIAGVNPDGTLDTTFGTAGIQSFEFSQNETPVYYNPLNADLGLNQA